MAKILILSSEFPPFRGGIATYALELARAAQNHGHIVTVVAPDFGEMTVAADAELPFAVRRYHDGPANMRGLPKRIIAAWRAARSQDFDVVHAADWPFFIAARLLPRRLAPRCILTLHGTEVRYMQSPKRRRILDILRFWQRGWASWISNSNYTHRLALEAFPVAPEDARPVPLGVSESWCSARTERGEARRRTGVTSGRLILASLGRVVPRKGYLVLADALALLPVSLASRLEWWIMGPLIDTDFEGVLRARIASLPVETRIWGALPVEDVQLRMSAADLFCLPGYNDRGIVEGFGLVFLEAAAYGVPSVATRSGGIPDAIDDGITGLLVPEKDPVALAEALTKLLEDDDLRHQMADAALDRARRSSWHKVMEQTYGGD